MNSNMNNGFIINNLTDDTINLLKEFGILNNDNISSSNKHIGGNIINNKKKSYKQLFEKYTAKINLKEY